MSLRRILISLALLPPFAAMAAEGLGPCPNLSGTFQCSGSVTTISESVVNGVVVYDVNGTKIPADGQIKTVVGSSDFQGQESYTCKQGTLVRALTMIPPLWMLETYSIDASGNLSINHGMQMPDGSTVDQGAETCTRR